MYTSQIVLIFLFNVVKRATFFDVSKTVFGKKWAEPAATPNP